jgi:hypothetical protein
MDDCHRFLEDFFREVAFMFPCGRLPQSTGKEKDSLVFSRVPWDRVETVSKGYPNLFMGIRKVVRCTVLKSSVFPAIVRSTIHEPWIRA